MERKLGNTKHTIPERSRKLNMQEFIDALERTTYYMLVLRFFVIQKYKRKGNKIQMQDQPAVGYEVVKDTCIRITS